MQTFIYKRTHQGDPNSQGHFGVNDCMKELRKCSYDAVIGIGGISDCAKSVGISRKVNWIGIGPKKLLHAERRGPIVLFDHFMLFEAKGPQVNSIAPHLARRLLRPKAARFVFTSGLTALEQLEVEEILRIAREAPPSLPFRSSVNRNARECVCPPSGCPPTMMSRKR